MAFVNIVCSVCDVEFKRDVSEVNRNQRLGRPTYCSRSCAGKANIRNIPQETKIWNHLRKGSQRDAFSPFRSCYRIAHKRAVSYAIPFELTLEDLKELWESQTGICPYTGWQMFLPQTSTEYNGSDWTLRPECASLDRIDSSKGYIKDNVQFVSYMANCAKNRFSHEEMLRFCRAVAKNWNA